MSLNRIRTLTVLLTAAATVAVTLTAQSSDYRTQNFKVGGKGRLELNVDSGLVVIRPGGGSEVSIQASGLTDPDENLQMYQRGNAVKVEYKSRREGGWRFGGSDRRARFDIDLPAQFDVDFTTSGADVRVEGNLDGSLMGRTSGGDITLRDLGGDLDVKTSGGDISAGSLRGESDIKTSGGDITIQQAAGRVDAKTSGGDIEVGDVGGPFDARTSGGSIQVGNVGAEAVMKTAGGDIEARIVEGGVEMSTAGGDIVLDAAYGHVQASTAGGSIRLEEVTGSVKAKTAGGDIEATLIPEGTEESLLKSAGGRLTLNLPASARVTIEAEIRMDGNRNSRWRRRGDYEIRSDFQAASYDRDSNTGAVYAVYQINGGGPLIRMETSHGDIDIRRSGR